MGFDFEGTYELVDPPDAVVLKLDNDRLSRTTFEAQDGGTLVRTVFAPDISHPVDIQREGWQAILDNYAAHVL